jgi:hypothetical protein
MRRTVFASTLAVMGLSGSTAAEAARLPLDPLNRIHAGYSTADRGATGFTLGMDSRLTRLLNVDVGAFLSPFSQAEVVPDLNGDPNDWITLRHGLFVAPGLRIPHRYGEGINWDLTVRGGFGAVWLTNATEAINLETTPAFMPSADLLLRKDQLGLRLGVREVLFWSYVHEARDNFNFYRTQMSAEAVLQF